MWWKCPVYTHPSCCSHRIARHAHLKQTFVTPIWIYALSLLLVMKSFQIKHHNWRHGTHLHLPCHTVFSIPSLFPITIWAWPEAQSNKQMSLLVLTFNITSYTLCMCAWHAGHQLHHLSRDTSCQQLKLLPKTWITIHKSWGDCWQWT